MGSLDRDVKFNMTYMYQHYLTLLQYQLDYASVTQPTSSRYSVMLKEGIHSCEILVLHYRDVE